MNIKKFVLNIALTLFNNEGRAEYFKSNWMVLLALMFCISLPVLDLKSFIKVAYKCLQLNVLCILYNVSINHFVLFLASELMFVGQ